MANPTGPPMGLEDAIATQGIPADESLSSHSRAPLHSEPIVPTDGSLLRTDKQGDRDSDDQGDDDDDDLVVFDAESSLLPTRSDSPTLSSHKIPRDRAESVSFGFRDRILPLSRSAGDDDDYDDSSDRNYGEVEGALEAQGNGGGRKRRRRRKRAVTERTVGLIDGIALTVGLQIGSGIFSSPGVVTLNAGSVGASLIVWIFSGILAWTGASSYAELGAAIPLNGGSQAYLNYSFGPLSAYLFAWTAIVALKPGSGAIIATIFGEYVTRVIFHATTSTASDPHEQGLDGIPGWTIKLAACLIVILVSLLNAMSAKLGTRTQVATTVVKLLALVAIPILAILTAVRGNIPETSKHALSSVPALFEGSATGPGAYALALYSGLWAFDGWDQSCYVAGEMKNVPRDLPRVIHSSLGIVMVMFVITVMSYFVGESVVACISARQRGLIVVARAGLTVLPSSLVQRTNTVALDFGSATLGPIGGVIFALLVAFSCFGALNGSVYTTARLVLASGREGYLPAMFGQLSPRTSTPLAAIILQLVLVLLFILFGSGFASLVNFYGVCAWSFYFATVLGLLVLRIKEPHLERPYKTWLPTPILFSAVALFLLLMPIFSAPLEAAAALGFVLAGVPAYFVTQKSSGWAGNVRNWWGGRQATERGEGGLPRRDEGVDSEEEVEMLPRGDGAGDEEEGKKGKGRA